MMDGRPLKVMMLLLGLTYLKEILKVPITPTQLTSLQRTNLSTLLEHLLRKRKSKSRTSKSRKKASSKVVYVNQDKEDTANKLLTDAIQDAATFNEIVKTLEMNFRLEDEGFTITTDTYNALARFTMKFDLVNWSSYYLQ